MSTLFDEQFLRRLEYLHLVSRKVYAGQQRAERRSKKVGSGLEFADHRDYAPGDDFRYLDWKVYARMERMLIRLHEEEEDLLVYLLLDCSRSMGVGSSATTKYQQAARLAAALGYIGLANLDRVSLIPFGDTLLERVPPLRGKKQIFKIFRALDRIEPQGKTALNDCVRLFTHQHKRRGMVVLLSDFYDPDGYEEAINLLRYSRFEPFVVHLLDDDELIPGLRGDLSMVDCETGEVREVTITPKLLKRYQAVHEAFCTSLETFCKSRNVSYFRTPIQVPYDEAVLRIFRAGGFLK